MSGTASTVAGMEQIESFQTAYAHRPDTVVPARSADDVRAAVAGSGDAPVTVHATGHGLTVPADGGLLITIRHLDDVRVDPAGRTARVGAGARWGQVITAAAAHGLAPRSGSFPGVGAVGYTLGGGLGVLGRTVGWAADHVRRLDVVTADGRLRTVDAQHEPDLFAGLLGSGGALGVVTAMEIDLLPITRLFGGGLFFDTDLIPDVLAAWTAWTRGVPESVTSSVGLVPIPDVPGAPAPLRGRHVAHVRVAHTGDAASGEELVAPLRAIGPRLIDTLGELAWTDAHTIHGEPDVPHAYQGTNALLRDADLLLPAVPDLAGPGASVPCVVGITHLGGALARPPAVPNVVGHREARYLLGVLSPLGDPSEVTRTHRALTDAVAPATLGRYLNTVYGERSTAGQVRTGFDDAGWARLLRLKAEHDPADRFRSGRAVPLPAPAAPAPATAR